MQRQQVEENKDESKEDIHHENQQDVQSIQLLQRILSSIEIINNKQSEMELKQKVLFDQHRIERINEMQQLETRVNSNIETIKKQSSTNKNINNNNENNNIKLNNKNLIQGSETNYTSPIKRVVTESKDEEDFFAPWTERIKRFSKPKNTNPNNSVNIKRKQPNQPNSPPDSSSSSEESSSETSTELSLTNSSSTDNVEEYQIRRRSSFVGNLKREMDVIANNQPLMYQLQPDFSDILLRELTPKAAMYFFKAIDIYQRKYNCSLKVATMIAPNVAEILIAENKHKNINDRTFYSLSSSKLLKLIQKHIRPNNVLTFLHHLITDVKFFYKGSVPDTGNFKEFYTSLLLYKDRFEKMFDFLAEKNNNNIPQLTNKPGGIIKIFLDKIPYKFGLNVFQGMKKKNYKTFHKFLKYFMKEVKKTSKLSELLKESDLRFGSLEENLTNPTKKQAFQKHNEINEIAEEEISLEKSFISDPEVKTNIEEIVQYLESEELDDLNVISQQQQKYEKNNTRIGPIIHNNNTKPILNKPINNNTMNQDKKKEQVPNGCFQKIIYDHCKKGDTCTYSHDRDMLIKTHSYYTQLLRQSKYQIQNSTNMRKLPGALMALEEDTNIEENYLSTIDMGILQDVYLNSITPTNGKFSIMHREGIIQTEPAIKVNKVLFDSGALHSSYAAKELIDRNREIFDTYIKKWNGKIKLGDNKTTISIEEIAVLPIIFYDDDGIKYDAEVTFCIFDTTGNELIIGLPDIVTKFPVLFKKMIDSASNNYEFNEQYNILTIIMNSMNNIIY